MIVPGKHVQAADRQADRRVLVSVISVVSAAAGLFVFALVVKSSTAGKVSGDMTSALFTSF